MADKYYSQDVQSRLPFTGRKNLIINGAMRVNQRIGPYTGLGGTGSGAG